MKGQGGSMQGPRPAALMQPDPMQWGAEAEGVGRWCRMGRVGEAVGYEGWIL